MTDQPAAIKATFSDFRLVRGRKCAQLVLEIPIEEADAVLSVLGGLPQPHSEKWVGVARLNGSAEDEPLGRIKKAYHEVSEKLEQQPKSNGESTKLSLQAVMRCKEPGFWKFLDGCSNQPVADETDAAWVVRERCGIDSRSGLNTDPVAAEKWRKLDARYQAWKRGME